MTTPTGAPHGRVLVPLEQNRDDAPPGLRVQVYDGAGPVPGDPRDVELYVVPYGPDQRLEPIAQLTSLRAVQVLTAGYDHVLPHLPPGVALHNGAGLHDASTAELAVALVLADRRELDRWVRDRDRGVWEPRYTGSLAGSRVVLVGYGGIGRAIAARLEPFEVDLVRVASRARPDEDVLGVDDLHDLLPGADVVILAVPRTPATRGLIGARELALMGDGALLVNVGRGDAVDTDALLAERGRVRAALDVLDPEPPPPGHPVWRAPGVILTPHVAGGSATFRPRARRLVAEQLRRWHTGEPLLNRVAAGGG